MKQIISAMAFILVIFAPLFTQGETSTSANSSGNASSAAVAIDENRSSMSTSGDDASTTILRETPPSIVTVAEPTVGIGKNENIEPISGISDEGKSTLDENKAVCNVSAERINNLTEVLEEFSPVNDRTIKILKLLATTIIGIAAVLILQIVILIKISQRKFRATRIEEGLNKF